MHRGRGPQGDAGGRSGRGMPRLSVSPELRLTTCSPLLQAEGLRLAQAMVSVPTAAHEECDPEFKEALAPVRPEGHQLLGARKKVPFRSDTNLRHRTPGPGQVFLGHKATNFKRCHHHEAKRVGMGPRLRKVLMRPTVSVFLLLYFSVSLRLSKNQDWQSTTE